MLTRRRETCGAFFVLENMTVAIFCAKNRRVVVALVSTFVVFLLMNAGGCVRMIGNFL